LEPNARMTLQIQVNLAGSLRASGRFDKAAPLLAGAYQRLTAQYGDQDSDSITCRISLAANLLAAGDGLGADRELRSLLAILRGSHSLGAIHPTTLLCANNHVAVLRDIGKNAEALATARQTADRLHEVLGANNPYALAATMNLAVCLADAGELDQSRALDEQTVPTMSALLGEEHPDALRARGNLALTRIASGESAQSETLGRIMAELGRQIGRNHPSVLALQSGRRVHRVLDAQPF
jgi:Tetratricopeptide repeat